ncbi:MAG: AzlD domain-containing protein [Lachnospiraceae bacterium]|nr:AzlD domain-containing protein [Lachnospiraceae bacterium]
MNWLEFLTYLLVMAGVTYLIRVLPYIFMRREVKNKFFKSFLLYVPYTVLAAMTIPAILFATDNIYSAIAGLVVAVIVALFEKGLLTVAISSCVAVLLVELVQKFVL